MKIRVAELIVILELCVVLVHFTNGEVSLTGRSEALYAVNKGSYCNVTGVWRSDQGSLLHLHAVGSILKGFYMTTVESSPGAAGSHGEAGLTGFVSEGAQSTVTFSVLWEQGSCTSWVGQCFTMPNGERVLKTHWMLRSVAKNPAENWMSTRFGEDNFTFVPVNEK
ncbi:avidin-related protein 4/5-like [Clupea harengus]|uniref:Avidin-related protein 4/5-like n=1 Tax=Clupea harengus TaxID=7950 RepID=A0A8M1KPS5_CLUHA|nr:avidin-related protein 4/5-like [Clupea harengus]